MTKSECDDKKYITKLIEVGSEITGQSTGAAIGFVTGGLGGTILGTTSGIALSQIFCFIGKEIKQRVLGQREEIRIGATLAFASQKIDNNIKEGRQIRTDDFFKDKLNERSAGKEILEGVLLIAQREHQEKKLQFYGNLIANIAFRTEIDRAQANLLIKLGDDILFRQMCLLTIFANKNTFKLRDKDYGEQLNVGPTKVALLQEIYELYSKGMLDCSGDTLLGLTDIWPSKINVMGTGLSLYTLMELWQINEQDLKEITELLID